MICDKLAFRGKNSSHGSRIYSTCKENANNATCKFTNNEESGTHYLSSNSFPPTLTRQSYIAMIQAFTNLTHLLALIVASNVSSHNIIDPTSLGLITSKRGKPMYPFNSHTISVHEPSPKSINVNTNLHCQCDKHACKLRN